MNEPDAEIGLGYHQHNTDKLTYKNIIADAINFCRKLKGHKEFASAVDGLEDVIYMDIEGYRLRDKIETIKEHIYTKGQEYINSLQNRQGRFYYARANIAKLKLFMDQWYYERYFEELIQLLAEHNLLLEHERYIPIRIKSPLREIQDDTIEGPTSMFYD